MVGFGPLGPPLPGAPLTLGFSQIHEKLPVDSFPVWRSAGFIVPSCNSSPGHNQKASGVEVFYYSFGQTGSSRPKAVAGKPSSPQPTPPPGGATPEQVGSASASRGGTRRGLSPTPAGAGWWVGWAINNPTVQIYSAGRGGDGEHRLPGNQDRTLWTRLCGEPAGGLAAARKVLRTGQGRHSREVCEGVGEDGSSFTPPGGGRPGVQGMEELNQSR